MHHKHGRLTWGTCRKIRYCVQWINMQENCIWQMISSDQILTGAIRIYVALFLPLNSPFFCCNSFFSKVICLFVSSASNLAHSSDVFFFKCHLGINMRFNIFKTFNQPSKWRNMWQWALFTCFIYSTHFAWALYSSRERGRRSSKEKQVSWEVVVFTMHILGHTNS